MEYKKLSNDGCSSCIPKVATIIGIVLTVFVWIILSVGLYKLNNEVIFLKAEHQQLIHKLCNRHEFDFGYSTEQDLSDYYDYSNDDSDEDEDEDDNVVTIDDLPINAFLGGGYYTKDGLESRRLKRDILGTTVDGVPVNSESYAEVKKKTRNRGKSSNVRLHPTTQRTTENLTTAQPKDTSPQYSQTQRSNDGTPTSTTKSIVYSRKSRVMRNDGKQKFRRRMVKRPMVKSFSSNIPDQVVSPDFTIVQESANKRRHRQRRVESSSRLRPAIHINGEVSERHPNYDNYLGNGRMHHYNKHFKNWTKDVWVENLGMNDYFELNDGYLRFLESGLYFVYAQIYYIDEHDTNGFAVYKNDDLILQCTTTSHTNHRVIKPNTCYTAGVIAFSNGDSLKIRDIEANRYSIFQKGKSFFGAVKLGESRET